MRAKAIAAGLALCALAILALPAGALAKPGFYRVPASTGFDFTLHGSDDYKIDVVGQGREVFVQAATTVGRRTEAAVDYRVHGRKVLSGSSIDVRLPGVARFKAEFVSKSVSEEKTTEDGCTGGQMVEKGYFVGSLVFHGERGFTKVDAGRVPGTISRAPAQRCPRQSSFEEVPRPAGEESAGAESGERTVQLIAGERRRGLSLLGEHVETTAGGLGSTQSFLTVSVSGRSHGLDTSHILIAFGESASSFGVSAPGVSPPDATLAPSSPFSGSATFQLKNSTKASWSGDLAVELPGLGTVPLAGPKFYSGLCEGEICTKTLPEWYLRDDPYFTSVAAS
ncbi:MAG TPA: hypothetical protein VH299_12295 [Solirubrobacterales bacterium]|nr:hypothetical protein [Solirubrobacterales bacterium]